MHPEIRNSWTSIFCLVGVLACGGDTTAPALSQTSKFWSLRLNQHAITLASISPYDTLTLIATPRMSDDTPLVTSGTVIYTSSDSSAVVVSPSGKLQARTTSTVLDVMIVARLKMGGVNSLTLADTAFVNVVAPGAAANIPVVQTFSIHPLPGDSAVRAADSLAPPAVPFPARILDFSGNPIPAVQVHYYTAANQRVARYGREIGVNRLGGNGELVVFSPGHVMLHADATVYGKVVADSFLLTIGYPINQQINIDTSMATGRATVKGFPTDTTFIGVGGTVLWHNALFNLPAADDSVDVKFDNHANVQALNSTIFATNFFSMGQAVIVFGSEVFPNGGGDIAPFLPPPPIPTVDPTVPSFNVVIDSVSTRGRVFSASGTYVYHSRFFPGAGVVKVIANSSLP